MNLFQPISFSLGLQMFDVKIDTQCWDTGLTKSDQTQSFGCVNEAASHVLIKYIQYIYIYVICIEVQMVEHRTMLHILSAPVISLNILMFLVSETLSMN